MNLYKRIKDRIVLFNARIKNKKENSWRIYFYYNEQKIKSIWIDKAEKPFEKLYTLNIYMKKHIFGSNFTSIVAKPELLKYTDKDKKTMHIEIELFKGVRVNE